MSTPKSRTNKVETTVFFFTGLLLTMLATACALSGWNNDIRSFVETGLSTVFLKSVNYTQAGYEPNEDVRPGTPVTVTVQLHNPKELALSYTLSYPASFVSGSVDAPADTTTATDGITTVSFIFTPTPAAEHANVTFSLGLHASDLNKTMVPASLPVRCDSPPGQAGHLTAGLQSDGKACIGFTLPDGYADTDISTVEITCLNTTYNTSNTGSYAVSRTGTEMRTPPTYTTLNSNDYPYVRYFLPNDVVAGDGYKFTVTLIDGGGHSGTPLSVSVIGTERYLAYDANGGTGTVAAVYGYNTNTTTIADGSSLSKSGYTFTGWTENADGSGSAYAPGDPYTFEYTDRILYAQWAVNSAITISTAEDLAAMQSDLSADYVLDGDIDLSSVPNWAPVGSLSNPFTGTLNGNGYSISNLSTATASGDAGLFGCIDSGAVIFNVHLENVTVNGGTSGDGVGGLAGENYGGTITRCSVSGSVSGYQNVGGLVGNNRAETSPLAYRSTISECYSTATVRAINRASGGLVGSNWGTISNCYAKSNVSDCNFSAGLIGSELGTGIVINCYSASMVTTAGGASLYGMIGGSSLVGTCTSSYFDQTLQGLVDQFGVAKSSLQMKTQPTYTGWDFSNVWAIDSGINGGYPYLRALPVPDTPLITSLTISAGEPRLFLGWAGHDSEQITTAILPSSASGNALSWSSSAPGVATVDANGFVTAVSPGTTTIMATATDGSGYDGTCTVSVPEELFFILQEQPLALDGRVLGT